MLHNASFSALLKPIGSMRKIWKYVLLQYAEGLILSWPLIIVRPQQNGKRFVSYCHNSDFDKSTDLYNYDWISLDLIQAVLRVFEIYDLWLAMDTKDDGNIYHLMRWSQ